MTVEERRKAGKVFVNLWGKVVGVQGAKPHARAMTKTLKSKTKKNKKIADQKNPCYARAAARRDGLLTEKKRSNQETNPFPDCFRFLSDDTPTWRAKCPHSPFRHSGEPLTRVPHAETFPRNISAPFLSFGKSWGISTVATVESGRCPDTPQPFPKG